MTMIAASQIGTVLAQTPAGALIDKVRRERPAVTIAGAAMLFYALTMPDEQPSLFAPEGVATATMVGISS
jgi:hypothetical protein